MTTDPDRPESRPQVRQTAVGHNVIQQVGSGVARILDVDINVTVLGASVLGLPILVLAAVVAFVALRSEPLEPLEGPGLKVAVAALSGAGTGGTQVGSFLATALAAVLPEDDFTVAGPNRVREVPLDAEAADRAAEALGADVMVYGEVAEAPAGPAGSVVVTPRLVVASQGTADALPFVLDVAWGAGITVVPDQLSSVDPASVAPLRSLLPFLGAVGAVAADNHDLARTRLEEAADPDGVVLTSEQRVAVDTMAGLVELRAASVTRDVATLPAAEAHFTGARDHGVAADVAEVGLVAVDYLALLDAHGDDPTDADAVVGLHDLVAAWDDLAAAADDPYAAAMARSLAAQAVLAGATSAGPAVNDAVARLTSLQEDLPDLQQRSWALFDSFIEEKLGFAAFLDGELDAAIAHYDAAVDTATPYWAAHALAAIGRLESLEDRPCDAAQHFTAARAIVQGRFPAASADYGERAGVAADACAAASASPTPG